MKQFTYESPMIFVNTRSNKGLLISNCEFKNYSTSLPEEIRGIGIKGFNSSFEVLDLASNGVGNKFENLYEGIESECSNSLSTVLNISGNTFLDCVHGISGNGFSFSTISNNKFTIPTSKNNFDTWGCYITGSSGFDIIQNEFTGPTTPSTDPNGLEYGVIVNSSAILPYVSNNSFTTLGVGTQTEQNNMELQIQCNDYVGVNTAMYINPYSQNATFNNQGSGCNSGQYRANNHFSNYSTCSSGKAINSLLTNSWSYWGWEISSVEVPEVPCYTNATMTVTGCGTGSDPNSQCDNWRICAPDNADCIATLKGTMSSLVDNRDRSKAIKEIVKFYSNENKPDSLTSFLNSISDKKALKLLLEKYIKYQEVNNANTKLSAIASDTLIESDFKTYSSILVGLLNDQKILDSLSASDKIAIGDLKELGSEIAEKAKSIVKEIKYDHPMRVPEKEPSLRRRNPELVESSILEGPLILNYPNPFSDFTTISIQSFVNYQGGVLVVRDAVGKIVDQFFIQSENSTFEISGSRLIQGVYYYSVYDKNGLNVATKPMVIVR